MEDKWALVLPPNCSYLAEAVKLKSLSIRLVDDDAATEVLFNLWVVDLSEVDRLHVPVSLENPSTTLLINVGDGIKVKVLLFEQVWELRSNRPRLVRKVDSLLLQAGIVRCVEIELYRHWFLPNETLERSLKVNLHKLWLSMTDIIDLRLKIRLRSVTLLSLWYTLLRKIWSCIFLTCLLNALVDFLNELIVILLNLSIAWTISTWIETVNLKPSFLRIMRVLCKLGDELSVNA